MELVRYIHLNPLRAGLVTDIDKLDRYPSTGHSIIMGKKQKDWHDAAFVLNLFAGKRTEVLYRYRRIFQKVSKWVNLLI